MATTLLYLGNLVDTVIPAPDPQIAFGSPM
jgi:hypothetical protein